jgi:hypothetical protein
MAGVFGLIKGPQRQLLGHDGVVPRADPRALELQAAKEILAETFGIKVSEVEEMIQSRSEAASFEDIGPKEDGLWPREFWLSD